jgi:hypothetical protein
MGLTAACQSEGGLLEVKVLVSAHATKRWCGIVQAVPHVAY